MEDSCSNQTKIKNLLWSFLVGSLIFCIFSQKVILTRNTKTSVMSPGRHAVLVPAVDCTAIILLLKGKKIKTQINKAKTSSIGRKVKPDNAKERNTLFDCVVAYLNVVCKRLLFYQFMNSWRKYLMPVPNHNHRIIWNEWIWQQNCQRNLQLNVCWFQWAPLMNEDHKVIGNYREFVTL